LSEVYTSVNLFVAPYGDAGTDGSGNLTPVFSQLANKIGLFFTDKMPPNVSLTILPPTFVPINITVEVHALPQFKQSTVKKNAETALQTILAFDNVQFADRISLHYVIQSLAAASGVSYSAVTQLVRGDAVSQAVVVDAECETYEIPEAGTITVTVSGGIED